MGRQKKLILCELLAPAKRMDMKGERTMRLILPLLAALLLAGCDFDDFGPSDRFKADFHYTLKPTGQHQRGEFQRRNRSGGLGRALDRNHGDQVRVHAGESG